tara:strand:+ start:3645 stop:4490 length:846 start_codon:yes stop_codon:yes gene_type:complete
MKQIFISGINGFLGKHLANFFSDIRYEVYGLSREFKVFLYSQDFGISKNEININDIKIDREKAFFLNSSSVESPDSKILDFYSVNFLHSLKLLNFCSDNKIKYFINLATTLDPESSPYANSKNLFSSQLDYFSNRLELKALNLFLEPVFGPGMRPPRLIPYVFEQCARNETAILNSSKDLRRHFIYIDDFLEAVGEIINSYNSFRTDLYISSKAKFSIKEIVDEILKLTNSKIEINYQNVNFVEYNFQTSDKVQSFFNLSSWRPKISLREGLNKILENDFH